MKARLLVIGAVLAAGCGLSAVATRVDPTDADPVVARDGAPEVDATDSSAAPGDGSSELPIDELDAGGDADLPRFEIVAPPGGKFAIFTPGAPTPCSTGSGVPASFTVKNLSSEKLRVWWVNYQCFEQDYGGLSAGNAKSQPTFVRHRWRIRSDVDGGIRGDFALGGSGTYQVIVR